MILEAILGALMLFGVSVCRERVAAILVMVLVAGLTVFGIVALLPPFEWIKNREALLLAAMVLFVMAGYLRLISPNRDEVPMFVTSGLAILSGSIAMIALGRFEVFTSSFQSMGIIALLILTCLAWFWYDVIYLGSFREHIDDVPLFEEDE